MLNIKLLGDLIDFLPLFTRETAFVISCLLYYTPTPQNYSVLKEKNALIAYRQEGGAGWGWGGWVWVWAQLF